MKKKLQYRPVYFNSLTKTVASDKYFLVDCFNEIIYRLESWISKYLNLSSSLPLSGST